MTAPAISITSHTRDRISDEAGATTSHVVFQADQALIDWEARADGAGLGQGLLVGKAVTDPVPTTWVELDALSYTWDQFDSLAQTWDQVDDRTSLGAQANGAFDVDWTELTWGNKQYRITVYGKNAAGEWSSY